jgi:uncharacterized protein YcsI (UPF0317 family)
MKKNKNNTTTLIIEEHPENYNGYEFITLIRYNDKNFLTIVDNVIDNSIIVYVLDFCSQLSITEEAVVTIANEWYENNRTNYPISIEFSKRFLGDEMSKILREFNTDFITRVIGPTYSFPMSGNRKIRRRKKKPLPAEVYIKN